SKKTKEIILKLIQPHLLHHPSRRAALFDEAKALYSAESPDSKEFDRINRMDRINSTTNPVNPVHPVQNGASFGTAPDSLNILDSVCSLRPHLPYLLNI
ncbi:MAG: hypothetical protein Q8O41_03830, partial [Candidatus Methanoperedens sp.]|nr:hypothetical protein [Candidatus Methanoperedens sp.]